MSIPDRTQLVRGLTLTDTTALVVGTVIGTGASSSRRSWRRMRGPPLLVLAAWVAAGLLSLAGALSYAELGAMLPQAGGEDVYLRQSYGQLAAFLFGWMRFVVAGSGSIAILGVGFATFLSAIVPMGTAWTETTYNALGLTMHWQFGLTQVVAIAAIVFFAIINCLTVVVGGRVQTALTVLKVAGIAIVVLGIAVWSKTADWAHLATPSSAPSGGAAALGLAMLAALWAYNGWNNMPMAAGEVKDPAATCRERSSAAWSPSWRSTAPPTSPTSTRCRGPTCSARIRRRTATRCRSPRKPRKRRSARGAGSSC